MKKRMGHLLLGVSVIMIIFITSLVSAEEKLQIIDVKNTSNASGILYSDHRLLLSMNHMEPYGIIQNVNHFSLAQHDDMYVYDDLSQNLHVVFWNSSSNGKFDERTRSNVVQFAYFGYSTVYYLDTDGNLYTATRNYEDSYNGESLFDREQKVASNVQSFQYTENGYTIMYLTNDNELYAIGGNFFGTKVNEGQNFTTPYLIMENVASFKEKYAITKNHELYLFSSKFTEPKKVLENVENVLVENWFRNISPSDAFLSSGELYAFYLKKTDGTFTVLETMVDRATGGDNNIISVSNEQPIDFQVKRAYGHYALSENGNLYQIKNGVYEQIDQNVSEICSTDGDDFHNEKLTLLVLHENGEVNVLAHNYSIAPNIEEFLETMTHMEYYTLTNELILKNVASLKFFDQDTILLKDGSVLRIGLNSHNQFLDSTIPSSYIPVKLNEFINNNEEIKSLQLLLSPKKSIFTVEDEFDYYATVIPFNAFDRDVSWSSSNPSVMSIDSKGLSKALSKGESKICATLVTNSNIQECVDVKVYPKVESVEILEGDALDVEKYQELILTAKVNPQDVIDVKYEWKSDSAVTLLHDYYDREQNKRVEVLENQIVVRINDDKTHDITVLVNGNFQDTITLKPFEKVSDVTFNLAYENYDYHDTLFMDLSLHSEIDLDYTVYPPTASNKNINFDIYDSSIARIVDGKLIAFKPGRTALVVTSEDGAYTKEYHLVVYRSIEEMVPGDMNGDGVVDLVDLSLMRQYLASLEN